MPNTMMKGSELGSKPLRGSDSLETWGLQGGLAVEGWCRLTPAFSCSVSGVSGTLLSH